MLLRGCRGCPRSSCTTRCWRPRWARTSWRRSGGRRGASSSPFVLVVEGSIPNEKIKEEGYWAAFGNDPATGQPITTCEWIDRLAPKALAVVAVGTCATYGGIHAMAGNPTGLHGRWPTTWAGTGGRKAGMPIVNVPGCPVQPDNFMETLLYLLYQAAGHGADDPAGRAAAADVAVRQDRARGLRPGGLLRAGRLRQRVRLAQVPGEARLLGAGRELQRAQARLDATASAAARTSAASASAAPCRASRTSSCRSWTSRRASSVSAAAGGRRTGRSIRGAAADSPTRTVEQGAEVATSGAGADHRLPRSGRAAAGGERGGAARQQAGAIMASKAESGGLVEMAWDPDHPHRRQPRHLHQDRLRASGRSPSATAPRRSSAATASS